MNKKSKVVYPITKKSMHAYAKSIFDPIRRGECVTSIWVPMAGRRTINTFLCDNIHLFKNELPNYDKYILIYLDSLDITEDTLTGYLKMILRNVLGKIDGNSKLKNVSRSLDIPNFEEGNLSVATLLQIIRSLVQSFAEIGYETVLFLGDFNDIEFENQVFHRSLKSLWNRIWPNLHYVFLTANELHKKDRMNRWGDLNQLLHQNMVYSSLLVGVEIDYILDKIVETLNYNLTKLQSDTVKRFCGGHPYLLMTAVKAVRDNSSIANSKEELHSLLSNHYALKTILTIILEQYELESKYVMYKIINGDKLDDMDMQIVDMLYKQKLIYKNEDDKLDFFSLLFRELLESTLLVEEGGSASLEYDEVQDRLRFRGADIEERFTKQEYLLLKKFTKSGEAVVSRSNIADWLWGAQIDEKYSDWAIDQVISKLRKKLQSIGLSSKIITVRGVGYKLVG